MLLTIDSKKRLPIASVMDQMGLAPGDKVDISLAPVNGGGSVIIVLPVPPRCAICGTQTAMLAEYGDDPVRSVCTKCAEELCSATLVFVPR